MKTLMCRFCKVMKLVEEFAPSHRQQEAGTCRQCNTERAKEYRHAKHKGANDQLSLSALVCAVCGQEKQMTEYRWNSRSGYKTECKECEKDVLRCTSCSEIKAHDEFPPSRKSSTGRHSLCKGCHSARMKEKYATDPKHRARHKKYSRSERAKKWRKEHWLKTKESQREYRRIYSNWKYHNDSTERNKIEARAAVNFGIKFGFIKKPEQCQSGGKYGVKCSGTLEAHHHKGYDRENWLEVEWLCVACHKAADIIERDKRTKE